MTVNAEDYADILDKLPEELRESLEGTFHEAARILSPTGMQHYFEGARGLSNLGRGPDLVVSWLQEVPLVAKEVGEDIIIDLATTAMKLSSMTSGEVITLMISSLPTAARRLGDAELVRDYLNFVHQLSAKAARGLRPMLNHIDELLGKLTLGGLKRWANFGAEAYRRDLNNLVAYFNLETQDARAMLQKERRGTLFIDTQRKLNFYLRALWGRDFFLRPASADTESFRPFIEARVIHMPDAVDDYGEIKGLELMRAIAAHMAAHVVYTRETMPGDSLSPAQMFMIGLLEDARIEYRAVQAFPGLGSLWADILRQPREDRAEHPTLELLERMALALLDPTERTGDEQLDALVERFHSGIADRADDNRFSFDLGLELFGLLSARREVPSLRILEHIRIPYRDDNRFVWHFEEISWEAGGELHIDAPKQVRKYVSAVEMANEVDCELAGDDAQEVWICATEFFPYEDAGEATVSYNEMWGKEPISEPYHYHEWDYQVQLHRPDWVTVYERRPAKGDPAMIERIMLEYRPISHRIRQIIDMLQPEGVQRERRLEDGDEIDINAAVEAMIDIRMGRHPDPRITMRNVIRNRDLAVTVLLDLSESTNETIEGSDKTILDLTREACALVATAINGIGDPFALHGFASDGRHDVHYYRFKDFNEKFNDEVRARLAGMKGGLSTRMGAAMRHAAHHLLRQQERKKLLLLITDGEPADIDERDPQYLRHDTKKAVEELWNQGIMTYCLTLDPNADSYVKRIFGANHYTIIDHVERLPEKLPLLFASLTS